MRDTRSPRVPAHSQDPDAAEAAELARALGQVETLYRTGRVPEALAACRPLATRYPREWRVLGMLGLLYAREGDIHQALERLTAALAVSPAHPVEVLTNLALVYSAADAPMHALQTWRSLEGHYTRVLRPPTLPDPAGPRATLTAQIQAMPGLTGLSPAQREETLLAAERGQLRLVAGAALPKIEAECRVAMRLAPRYTAPYLTLSRAQFLNGQTTTAVATLEARVRAGEVPAEVRAALAVTRYWVGSPVEECRALLAEAEAALPPTATAAQRGSWRRAGARSATMRRCCGCSRPWPLPTRRRRSYRRTCPRAAGACWRWPGPIPGARRTRWTCSTACAATARRASVTGSPPWNIARRCPARASVTPTWPGTKCCRRPLSACSSPPPPRNAGHCRPGWTAPRRPAASLRDRLLAAYPRLAEVGALLLWSGDPAVEQLGVRLLKLLGNGGGPARAGGASARAGRELCRAARRGLCAARLGGTRQRPARPLLDRHRLGRESASTASPRRHLSRPPGSRIRRPTGRRRRQSAVGR